MNRKMILLKGFTLLCFCVLSAITVWAQDFCEGNFDYDQDVDGGDAALFKSDFGRSPFKNPCPPKGPAPVPKTGQYMCYSWEGIQIDCTSLGTGQDGHLQQGVEWPDQRFTDNGNGTVTDNLTGLLWLKDANCFGARTWTDALSDCNGLASGSCGLSDGSSSGDWRLPNVRELFSLVEFGLTMPPYAPPLPLGHPFNNVLALENYWTSTTVARNKFKAFVVYFGDGWVTDIHKDFDQIYVWPVRN